MINQTLERQSQSAPQEESGADGRISEKVDTDEKNIVFAALVQIANGETSKTPLELCNDDLALARILVIGLVMFSLQVPTPNLEDRVQRQIGSDVVVTQTDFFQTFHPDEYIGMPVDDLREFIAKRVCRVTSTDE
jgi:hypothetical protein